MAGKIAAIAEEVRTLHERDDELTGLRVRSEVEQRDIRLRVGELVSGLEAEDLTIIAGKSGYPIPRLRQYAAVRKAWPDGSYPDDASFTAMEELARHPDRTSLITSGMSKRDARAARGGMVDTPSRWSATTKAEFVQEVLSDPEVASQVFREVGRQKQQEHEERVASVRSDAERSTGRPGVLTAAELIARGSALALAVDRWQREIEAVQLTDDQRRHLGVAARRISNNATAIEASLGLGDDIITELLAASQEN